MSIKWEHFVNSFDSRFLPSSGGLDTTSRKPAHTEFVRQFAQSVSTLSERTDSLIDTYDEITRTIDQLATCAYTHEAFAALLAEVQKTIDRLSLEGYANVELWTAELDAKIEKVLVQRLRRIVDRWCVEFGKEGEVSREQGSLASRKKAAKEAKEAEVSSFLFPFSFPLELRCESAYSLDFVRSLFSQTNPDAGLQLKSLVHEIRIQNQVIYLDPPIEQARADWYRQLHQWLGVVCGLRRIQSSRYEIGLKIRTTAPEDSTYTTLVRSDFLFYRGCLDLKSDPPSCSFARSPTARSSALSP